MGLFFRSECVIFFRLWFIIKTPVCEIKSPSNSVCIWGDRTRTHTRTCLSIMGRLCTVRVSNMHLEWLQNAVDRVERCPRLILSLVPGGVVVLYTTLFPLSS